MSTPVRSRSTVGSSLGSMGLLALAGLALGAPPAFEVREGHHPVIASGGAPVSPGSLNGLSPTIPVLSPGTHATGPYVNYESPPVKPLAVSRDGSRLFAVNTPDNSVLVVDPFGADEGRKMKQLARIGVGLEPVSVVLQPVEAGVSERYLWAANFVSDDLSVIEIATGKVVATIPVGDEPVNILFDADGSHAFVITQGNSVLAPQGDTTYRGSITVIDTETLQPESYVSLDCNTPRAAVYDVRNRRLVVAALHSGNDTTVVGQRNRKVFGPTQDPPSVWVLTLDTAQTFSVTASIFAGSAELSPWPDVGAVPNAPLTHRIIRSRNGPWQAIADALTLPDGSLDPSVVQRLADETHATNPDTLLQAVVDDGADRVDHDLLLVDVSNPQSPSVVLTIPGVGTTLPAMALNPVRNRVMVANLEPRNLTRLLPNLRGHFMSHELVSVDLPGAVGVITPPVRFDLHARVENFDDASAPNPAAQAQSLANPVDVVFSADGTRAYVASLGADRVGVVNAANGTVLARVDVGRGPRGLALDPLNHRLYCYNRTDMSISVVDIREAQPRVHQEFPLFTPEHRDISEGRNLLFTTKISNNASSSCAMCHIDGRLDHLAWDLGDPGATALLPVPSNLGGAGNHPVKGPMVTMSLQGLKGHNAFHWRGDKPRFADFNEAFDGLLGGSQVSDLEMDRFDAYVMSMTYPPNPFYDHENRFKSGIALSVGAAHYANSCNACHGIGHDGTFREAGREDDFAFNFDGPPLFLQAQEITQLRGIYKKFPSDRYGGFGLLHDGSEESQNNGHPLSTFLNEFFPGISQGDHQGIIDFVGSFQGNSMGAVGWQLTFRDLLDVDAITRLLPMVGMSQQSPPHCDVAVRAVIGGEERGFVLLKPASGEIAFMDDRGSTVDLTGLMGQIAPGDVVTFLATPPGSGERIGVNWDGDCLLNGVDPQPLSSPDYNRDGEVNPDDLGDFITDYFAVPPAIRSDYNRDGEINPDDLADMITQYFTCVVQ